MKIDKREKGGVTILDVEGKINPQDLDMMVVTDDVEEAVALMVAAREDRWPTPSAERPE